MNEQYNEQDNTALQRNVHQVYVHRTEHEFCAYCGAPLDQNYYFCPVCATPYKSYALMTAHIKPVPLTESELVRKYAPHAIKLFWNYAAVLLVLAIVCFVAFEEEDRVLALVIQTTGLFITTCVYAVVHWKSLAVQFKTVGFNKPAAWIGLAILVPLVSVNYVYHSWLRSLVEDVGITEWNLHPATVFFFFCLSPAILEEIAFRGLVQHWLTAAIRPMRAMMLASALFTALHFSIVSFPYLFAVGMLLGWTKWKTNSLYPPILIHFLHNWIVMEYFY